MENKSCRICRKGVSQQKRARSFKNQRMKAYAPHTLPCQTLETVCATIPYPAKTRKTICTTVPNPAKTRKTYAHTVLFRKKLRSRGITPCALTNAGVRFHKAVIGYAGSAVYRGGDDQATRNERAIAHKIARICLPQQSSNRAATEERSSIAKQHKRCAVPDFFRQIANNAAQSAKARESPQILRIYHDSPQNGQHSRKQPF